MTTDQPLSLCPFDKKECNKLCVLYRAMTDLKLVEECGVPRCALYQALTPRAVEWEQETLAKLKNGERIFF